MSSGLDRLPTKLGAAVKEYLRQRESGTLQGHWTLSLQLAKLLRGAHLSGDDDAEILSATKQVLIEMDTCSEMLVRCMAHRLAKADNKADSFVEEVKLAPTDLQAEVLGYSISTSKKSIITM